MNKYRFLAQEHLHQLFVEEANEWRNLTGTSTVVSVISKPLTWWASGEAVKKLGWSHPKTTEQAKRIENVKSVLAKVKGMSEEEFLMLLDEAYKAHAVVLDDSAEKGTDLHEILERFVGGKEITSGEEQKIKPFIEWYQKNVAELVGSEVHTYSEKLWTGGIVDAVVKMKTGDVAVLDFKSSREARYSHFLQAGGYACQLLESGFYTENGDKLGKVDRIDVLYIIPFGGDFNPVYRKNVNEFMGDFEAAVRIYRSKEFFEKI